MHAEIEGGALFDELISLVNPAGIGMSENTIIEARNLEEETQDGLIGL